MLLLSLDRMKVDGLIFNQVNIEHIARHNVLPTEVKQLLEGETLFLKAKLERIMAIGQTKKGRSLAVILEKVRGNTYFVVTARDADRKERRMYKEGFEGGEAKEESYEKNSN